MYFKCEGIYSLTSENAISCDNWVTVTQTELLGNIVQQYQMPVEDFAALSAFIFAIFALAYGIRATIQASKPEKED